MSKMSRLQAQARGAMTWVVLIAALVAHGALAHATEATQPPSVGHREVRRSQAPRLPESADRQLVEWIAPGVVSVSLEGLSSPLRTLRDLVDRPGIGMGISFPLDDLEAHRLRPLTEDPEAQEAHELQEHLDRTARQVMGRLVEAVGHTSLRGLPRHLRSGIVDDARNQMRLQVRVEHGDREPMLYQRQLSGWHLDTDFQDVRGMFSAINEEVVATIPLVGPTTVIDREGLNRYTAAFARELRTTLLRWPSLSLWLQKSGWRRALLSRRVPYENENPAFRSLVEAWQLSRAEISAPADRALIFSSAVFHHKPVFGAEVRRRAVALTHWLPGRAWQPFFRMPQLNLGPKRR